MVILLLHSTEGVPLNTAVMEKRERSPTMRQIRGIMRTNVLSCPSHREAETVPLKQGDVVDDGHLLGSRGLER